MAKRVHSREFKLEAVRLVQEQSQPVTKVARELGIHPNSLRDWLKKIDRDTGDAFPGQGKMTPADARVARLERELKRVTAERDILKKAIAYFAKEPTCETGTSSAMASASADKTKVAAAKPLESRRISMLPGGAPAAGARRGGAVPGAMRGIFCGQLRQS